MASPVPVSAFQALTSKTSDPIRVRLVKFVRFLIFFNRWYKYVYDDNRAFTANFTADLCKIPCDKTTT